MLMRFNLIELIISFKCSSHFFKKIPNTAYIFIGVSIVRNDPNPSIGQSSFGLFGNNPRKMLDTVFKAFVNLSIPFQYFSLKTKGFSTSTSTISLSQIRFGNGNHILALHGE